VNSTGKRGPDLNEIGRGSARAEPLESGPSYCPIRLLLIKPVVVGIRAHLGCIPPPTRRRTTYGRVGLGVAVGFELAVIPGNGLWAPDPSDNAALRGYQSQIPLSATAARAKLIPSTQRM
jgi:hypothetical protein